MNVAHDTRRVVLVGRGPLTLRPADHIATGGEASVYQAKGTAVKLYTDTAKMQRDGMADKLTLLAALTHPAIVAPQGLVQDSRGAAVGYYMPHVMGEALARAFTSSFWQRTGFRLPDARHVADGMHEVVRYAHRARALMVDANELNWLVVPAQQGGFEPRAIDVDSWAIGRWPATVIMPSICDYHAKVFSERTDWFAWGIVTFQLFTGIHPYKGTLAGYDRGDLERRMRENASVFRSGVRLNAAVRDLNTIPGPLLDWYRAVFERGERTVPPSPNALGVPQAPLLRTLRVVTTARGALTYARLRAVGNDPARMVYAEGLVLTGAGALVSLATGRTLMTDVAPRDTVTVLKDAVVVARTHADRIALRCVAPDGTVAQCDVHLVAHGTVRGGGRLFAVTDQGLQEIGVRRVGGRFMAAVGARWPMLPRATVWYDDVGVMDALGAAHLVLPFGTSGVALVRVPELDAVRVLAARAAGRIVVLTAVEKNGAYVRMDIVFDAAMQRYTLARERVDVADQNVAVLPRGVVASIHEDGELVIRVPSSGVVNKVADKDLMTDMALARWDDRVLYLKDGVVWSLSMK